MEPQYHNLRSYGLKSYTQLDIHTLKKIKRILEQDQKIRVSLALKLPHCLQ